MDRDLILKVKELRNNGISYGKIALALSITKAQAVYIARLDPEKKYKKGNIEFEEVVCGLVEKSKSLNEVCKMLGHRPTNVYYDKINKIIEKYNLDISHFSNENINREFKEKIPLEKIMQENGVPYQTSKLRIRLIEEGIKEHKCEMCGFSEWQGKPIPLQLHHINGDRKDNRLENLQLLCPNCHAFTDNYCGKKNSKKTQQKNDTEKKVKKIDNIIDKETLLIAFKKHGSYRGVGREFCVCDNTIRKWFEKYDLPIESKEMRQYVRNYFGEDLKWKFTNGNSEILREYSSKAFQIRCLLDENGNIEKIYHSNQEIKDDGFTPKHVMSVCKGALKTHKKRKFAFLKNLNK